MTGPIDPATIAWLRLARIYHRIDLRSAETMKCFGLSVSRFDVLNHAGTPEGRTQQELAAALLVTKGNVTQLLDGLEQDGLIERRRDGRAKRIYLTDRGRDLRQRAVTAQEEAIAAEFSVLDQQEQRQLIALLRRVERRLADRT
jgi:DNA-binding MarR family transcriptional regulator